MPMTQTTADDGTTSFGLGVAGTFNMPPLAEAEAASVAATMFRVAGDSLADMAEKVAGINSDTDLSDTGRQRKLDPLRKDVILMVAQADRQLDDEIEHFAKRERELTQIPALDPTHAAMAVEDREIRDWWARQDQKVRSALMTRIQEQAQNHDRMMIALLRSPVPQLDHEVALVRGAWDAAKRAANPAEALAIDAGRASVEWARRGLANVSGLARMSIKWEPDQIIETLLTSENPRHHSGFKAFGFSAIQAEAVKRAIAHRARARY